MKKIEPVKIIIAIMVLITAAAAVLHFITRSAVAEGTLRIENGGQVLEIPLERLKLAPVQGSVRNGKGEERTVDALGILVSHVLREAGIADFSEVTVTAEDEYSAVVTAEEVNAPDRVYLIQQEGNEMQLIVFGDDNSKRNVSNVARLSIR